MKWIFLFLTLSVAALLLAVFSTPVYVRIQLALNRRETFARVSFGIIRGLIWFTVYRVHDTTESEERDPGKLLIKSLEDLIRHPETLISSSSDSLTGQVKAGVDKMCLKIPEESLRPQGIGLQGP